MELKRLEIEIRIAKLLAKDPIANARIIAKLKRKLRLMEL